MHKCVYVCVLHHTCIWERIHLGMPRSIRFGCLGFGPCVCECVGLGGFFDMLGMRFGLFVWTRYRLPPHVREPALLAAEFRRLSLTNP